MAGLSYKFGIDEAGGKGLDAILSKVQKTDVALAKADKTLKALNDHLRLLKAPGEIAKLTKDIEDFGKETKKSGGNFMDFFGAGLAVEGVKLLGRGIMSVAGAVAHLGEEALMAAAGAERLDLSLKLTMGEGTDEFLEWIDKITPKTEFVDDQLKKWGLSLANAGLKGEELKDVMAASLDVAGKRGPQAMDMAVDALTRATLTGKIEGKALRGLGIPIAQLAELPQFKGLNEHQIDKRLNTTQIDRDDIMTLIAGPDQLLGDMAVKASDTMGAKLKNLKMIPEQVFEKLATSPAFEKFKSKLDEIFVAFDPNSPRGAQVFSALDSVFTTLVDQFSKIDFQSLATTITDDVVPAIKGMAEMIAPTVEAIERVIRGLHRMHDMVLGASPKSSALDNFKTNPNFKRGGVSPDDEPTFLRGKESATAAAKGIDAGAPSAAQSMTNMGKGMMSSLDTTLERHSPPRVFVRVGQDIPRAVAQGIEDEQTTLDGTMRTMVPVPQNGASATTMAGGGVTVHIEVNVGEGANAQETGQAIGDALEERLMRFFEQRAAQQGTG